MSEDPEGFEPGDPNLYRYTGNSPTNFTDPSGLDYIKVEKGYAWWVTEKYGWVYNSDAASYRFGVIEGEGDDRRIKPDPQSAIRWSGSIGLIGLQNSVQASGIHRGDWKFGENSVMFAIAAILNERSTNEARKLAEAERELSCGPDITEFRGQKMAQFPTTWDPKISVGQAGVVAAAAVAALGFEVLFGALSAVPAEGVLAKLLVKSIEKSGLVFKGGQYVLNGTGKQMATDQARRLIIGQFKKDLPAHVKPTLDRIKKGIKHPHVNDGIARPDLQKRLPRYDTADKDPHYFQEWVHADLKGSPGGERIVTGKLGEVYYSPNHYKGFIRLDDDSFDIIDDILSPH